MKKITALVLALVLSLAVFAGCTSAEESSSVNLSDLLSQINENHPEAVNGLTQLTEKTDLKRYYEIDEDIVNDFAAEINTDSSSAALEIVIVNSTDPDEAAAKLNIRYQAIISQYASYSAEQLKMAKEGGVETVGDYVFLVVSENAKDIIIEIKDALQ